jgi:hypothetical protein
MPDFKQRAEEEEEEEDEEEETSRTKRDSPFTEFYAREQCVYMRHNNSTFNRFEGRNYYAGQFVNRNLLSDAVASTPALNQPAQPNCLTSSTNTATLTLPPCLPPLTQTSGSTLVSKAAISSQPSKYALLDAGERLRVRPDDGKRH